MTTLIVQHTVQDFAEWKPVFDGHQDSRRRHGATQHRVLRDGNNVTILIDFPDRDSATGFAEDPDLREAMSKAGAVGAPAITFADEVEALSY
ncbi:MAG TPA: hypothetical protein VFG63_10675 [Nocardioidaceae bacterium]|nr:hypothetical protein [Nocardioidaceae bacterium]